MNRFLQLLLLSIKASRGASCGLLDVGRLNLWVRPTDLDALGHMNNGIYFSIMDLGRVDLMIRSGMANALKPHGVYPVAAQESMTFRKSLSPFQKYVLETRVAGFDERGAYMEQRFVVDGEIYAQAFVRARFIRKSGGTVMMAELLDMLGVEPGTAIPVVPEWAVQWAEATRLPSTRSDAPSVWKEVAPVVPASDEATH